MRYIPAIVILTILTRLGYFYAMQGVHNPKYFAQIGYLKDSLQYLIIAMLLSYLAKKQVDYCRLIIKFGMFFCYSLVAVLLLYGFLPDSISYILVPYIWAYFTIWSMISICLVFYYVHCLKGDLLA